jgi:hypothetical protein
MKRAVTVAPWFFIIIWSSGWVVARYASADADVLYFLAIRLLLATAILLALTLALKVTDRWNQNSSCSYN